ncbi:MAG: hypothetical protein K5841_04035 [Fretibacterium sp.]|nr:hypothetical protein [Fretibacterium sp.]
MDDKGKIVGSADVDENLALQVWTKDHSPRLVIFNKNKNTKKMIHFSWIEKKDRKLTINGAKRGQTISYLVEDFLPVIRQIIVEYAQADQKRFLQKLKQFVVDFDRVVHSPELITNKKDLAMLSEDKRSSLWLADCTGEDKRTGVFQPFFPYDSKEAEALTEERLTIGPDGHGADVLLRSGVVALLKKANPLRWHNPVRLMAAAMLMGFSFCDEDGSEFGDSLWVDKAPQATEPSFAASATPMKTPVGLSAFSLHTPGLMQMGHKLVAYIRHFDAVDGIESGEAMDGVKEMEGRGYTRTRRFDFQEKTIGDVPYRVTFYENAEEERMGLSCEPRAATARHKGELLYTFPTASYKKALKEDTRNATEDDFYTMTQLVWARQFRNWYDNVSPYIGKLIGLV